MVSLTAVLARAKAAGLTWRLDGARLVVSGPKSGADLARAVLDFKAQVVAILAGPAALPPDQRERYEERAAIMEFDAGLSRAEAERLALEEVLSITTEEHP
jgi:hypothetical protein